MSNSNVGGGCGFGVVCGWVSRCFAGGCRWMMVCGWVSRCHAGAAKGADSPGSGCGSDVLSGGLGSWGFGFRVFVGLETALGSRVV